MLALCGVSASYGSVPAVGDVNIEVGEGEAVGLLGANGAGKSSIVRALTGLARAFFQSSWRDLSSSTVTPPWSALLEGYSLPGNTGSI